METQKRSWGLEIMQLVVAPDTMAGEKAREILNHRDELDISVEVVEELVETIIVYKFPRLSREEIAQMLGLAESIKQTRVYQEGLAEGRTEGREEEGRILILKLLQHRFGTLPTQTSMKIEQLSLEELESLGEALLDFSSVVDLEAWLAEI